MERAYFASAFAELARLQGGGDAFQRVYFGHETCAWRFPAEGEIERARGFAAREGYGFTLVTPPVYQRHRDNFLHLIDRFRPRDDDEVVFNDIGLLHEAATTGLGGVRVMGRLLFPLATDQRLARHLERIGDPRSTLRLLADPTPPSALLALGVRRREIDSPFALRLLGLNGAVPLPLSFHLPLAILTVTRLCPWIRGKRGWQLQDECPAPCRGTHLRLRDDACGAERVIIGNAWYTWNGELPEPLSPAVDRLVTHGVPR